MSRYLLQRRDDGLRLIDLHSHQHPLKINFSDAGFSYRLKRGGGRNEMLARAVGVKPGLKILDCTAGLGKDSFLLASLGCHVTLIERSPVMALLLEDAIKRALLIASLHETASRMTLVRAEAHQYLAEFNTATDRTLVDVILVDPMFPDRKKSAKVKGEMQFLQRFLGPDQDARSLVQVAIGTGCKRVVLKRPLHAPDQAEMKSGFSLKGKTSRFDVYLQ